MGTLLLPAVYALLIEEYTVRGALLFAGWTIYCGPYSVQRIFSLA